MYNTVYKSVCIYYTARTENEPDTARINFARLAFGFWYSSRESPSLLCLYCRYSDHVFPERERDLSFVFADDKSRTETLDFVDDVTWTFPDGGDGGVEKKKRFRKIGSFYTLSRFYIVYKPPPHLSRIKKYRSFQGKSEKTLQFHDDLIVVNRRRRSNVIRARLSVQQLSRNSWRA